MNSKDLAMLNRLKKIASGGGSGGQVDTSYVDAQDAKTLSDAKSYTDDAVKNKAEKDHDHDGVYSPANHDHDGVYAPKEHDHDQYLTEHQDISGKANVSDLTSHTGNTSNPHGVTKDQIGLGNVENKSSATIRSELTKANVTDALGYTPPTENTTYSVATQTSDGLMSSSDKVKLDGLESGGGNVAIDIESVTLSASGWTLSGEMYVQTVNVAGVTENSIILVSPDVSNGESYSEFGVMGVGQGTGTITFNAYLLPNVNLKANILNLGDGR